MKCLRCETEMKHYGLNINFKVYGRVYDPGNGYAMREKMHNPQSVFECPKCGYMELSSLYCENPDI